MLYVWLLACPSSPVEQTIVIPANKPEPKQIETTGEWVIGEIEDCTSPQSNASWTDQSASLFGADRQADDQPAGCIALIEQEEEWIVAVTTSHSIRWRNLSGSIDVALPMQPTPVRLRVDDFDNDGQWDALVYSNSVSIGWSFLTENAVWDTLVADQEGCTLRDIAVVDKEGDGDLDLIVPGLHACRQHDNWIGALLENLGDRTFSHPQELDVADDFWGVLFDAIPIDIDGDSDLDIYMCNDFGSEFAPNGWLMNDNGDFVAGEPFYSDVVAHCMGASFGDVDQDGLFDIYVAGNGNQFLLINSPAGWIESSSSWSLPSFKSLQMAWGSAFTDYDNDGLIDLVVTTSDFAGDGHQLFPIWMLRQTPSGTFVEEGESLGFAQLTGGRGIIVQDVNLDGVVDFLIADAFGDPWFYVSNGCTSDNWIEVSAPSGSTVAVNAGGKQWNMLASNNPGFAASQPAMVHIGLGEINKIDSIVVKIPYRGTATLQGPLETRRRLTVIDAD